jgi:hypothetical protein
MKHLVFRFFPLLALVALVVGLSLTFTFARAQAPALSGAVVAGVLGFCYFIQQQALAETLLFRDLFTAFNARYDGMNERLARIRGGGVLGRDEKDLLIDYLNLCAEEYLFYQRGYILPEVWRTWCRGAQQYLEIAAISDVITEELASDAYYGLSLSVLRSGAA